MNTKSQMNEPQSVAKCGMQILRKNAGYILTTSG
jgi:hypothetical protein